MDEDTPPRQRVLFFFLVFLFYVMGQRTHVLLSLVGATGSLGSKEDGKASKSCLLRSVPTRKKKILTKEKLST